MRARVVIIVEVISQGSVQVIFTDDDQMIETLSANRANYEFGVWILERRMWRGDHFLNLHPIHPASKLFSIDRISISQEIARRGIIRKGFDDLLSGPLGCRIRCHIEMNDLPAPVKKDDEAVQNAEIYFRDSGKIYGLNLIRMIGKKCSPSLRLSPLLLNASKIRQDGVFTMDKARDRA